MTCSQSPVSHSRCLPVLLLLPACFSLVSGEGFSADEIDDNLDAVLLMQGNTRIDRAVDNAVGKDDLHIKSDLKAMSNSSTAVKHATSNVAPKPEVSHLAQKEIVFQVKGKTEDAGVNKILYVLLCMLAPCGCFGVDRCFMGQCYLGCMKGFSLGGLGIWFLCDYCVCAFVALSQKNELTTAGYDVVFDESTNVGALVIAIIIIVLNCWQTRTSQNRMAEQRAALQQLNEQLQQANQPAADAPMHHHSLPFMPTQLTSALRKAGLVGEKPTVPELITMFKSMDKDGNGLLDRDELVEALAKAGTDPEAMDALIKEADTDGDGKISLPEFLVAMKKD
mmetsp:Transcript_23866/g.43437  ORF Transcript_23866/g.43437 Transcript_23866/m.43437 type:complete len:336 (-) Transcript_23866:254-1261(-)